LKSIIDRGISDVDREIYSLELERAKINSQKSIVVLDKGLMLYFVFILTAVLGYINKLLDKNLFNVLILLSFCVLIIVLISYVRTMTIEQGKIDSIIRELKLKRGGK
jgi:hypothetical protein